MKNLNESQSNLSRKRKLQRDFMQMFNILAPGRLEPETALGTVPVADPGGGPRVSPLLDRFLLGFLFVCLFVCLFVYYLFDT